MSPFFMVTRIGHNLLKQMTEWSMTEVVQQRCCDGVSLGLIIETHLHRQIALSRLEMLQQPYHQMSGPDGMREPAMLRSREHKRGHPKLPNSPQALHFSRCKKARHYRLSKSFKGNEPMHWIT